MSHEPSPSSAHPYAAWRHRGYRLFLGASALSWTAKQIVNVTLGWELYKHTGSAMSLGYLGLIRALPVMLLALPAGHWADRHSRRGIILAAAAVSLLATLSLGPGLWRFNPAWIYSVVLIDSIANAIGWTARSALMPQLIPPAVFPNAASWSSTIFQITAMGGPALGGVLLSHIGVHTLYVAAALQLGAWLFMFMLSPPEEPARTREPPSWETLLSGVRFVFRTPLILAAATMDLFAVLLGGATYLLPIFAKDILGVDERGMGWLLAAEAVGAACMGLCLAHRPPLRRPGLAMLLAVAGFGAAMIVFGISRNFWLSFAMLGIAGAMDNVSVLVRHSLVQLLTPNAMRGRVSAVNNVFISSSNDLGGLESGLAAAWLGPVLAVALGGVGTILVVLAMAAVCPRIAKLGKLSDLRPE